MHHTGFHILQMQDNLQSILHLIGFHILQMQDNLILQMQGILQSILHLQDNLSLQVEEVHLHIKHHTDMVEDYLPYPYVQPSPPFGGGGCFTANTMVWMSDSVPKEISKVAVGDMVYSWNFRLGKLERVSVIDVMEPRQSIVYKIELESGHDIEVTGGHPFCVEEQGWKVVSMEDYKKEVEDGNTWDSEEVKGEIKVGDCIMDVNNALLDQDLHESKVKSITKLEEQTVYHFGVDGESHNFFANGMMVHNFQEKR